MNPYRNVYGAISRSAVREREDKPPGEGGTPSNDPSTSPNPTPAPPGGSGGEPMPPGTKHTPDYPPPNPPQPPPSSVPSGPVAIDPGYGSPLAGPSGIGGTGGYGFTNLAQYLYASPTKTGPGSGMSPTPTGMLSGSYNPELHGFAPNGGYTPGMAAVDNSLNAVYGRTGIPYTPSLSTPPTDQSYPNIYDNINNYRNRPI